MDVIKLAAGEKAPVDVDCVVVTGSDPHYYVTLSIQASNNSAFVSNSGPHPTEDDALGQARTLGEENGLKVIFIEAAKPKR